MTFNTVYDTIKRTSIQGELMRNILLLLITLFTFGANASVLVLDHNTITIRGGIDDDSMNTATKQLLKLSNELKDTDVITIAIDDFCN